MPASIPLTVTAPAKVNVVLRVGPVRPDGYHPVATLYLSLDLSDRLEFAFAKQLSIELTKPNEDVPLGPENLAAKAAIALAERAGIVPAVRIRIDKRIPVAGGLAGGSADAAGALVGCNALWHLGMTGAELEEVAATLGSDVPFSLRGGCAIGRDRGNDLHSITVPTQLHWVLLNPPGGLSTAAAYRRFDERTAGQAPAPELDPEMLAALAAGDVAGIGQRLGNDLQPDALAARPDLADILARMRAAGLAAIVSGSGPTLIGLADSKAAALAARDRLRADLPTCLVECASGPVPGARVVS